MNAGSRLGQLWGLKYLHSLNRKGHDKAGPPLLTYVAQLLISFWLNYCCCTILDYHHYISEINNCIQYYFVITVLFDESVCQNWLKLLYYRWEMQIL